MSYTESREEKVIQMGSAIAERLTAARERVDIGQRELARTTGIPQATLSRIEAGRREVKANELLSLAWALGCTVTELTGSSAVRARMRFAARATEGADMAAMKAALTYCLELDAYLDEYGVTAPR